MKSSLSLRNQSEDFWIKLGIKKVALNASKFLSKGRIISELTSEKVTRLSEKIPSGVLSLNSIAELAKELHEDESIVTAYDLMCDQRVIDLVEMLRGLKNEFSDAIFNLIGIKDNKNEKKFGRKRHTSKKPDRNFIAKRRFLSSERFKWSNELC